MFNCPNCGAPITQDKCPYCGTVFLDFAAIQVGAPSYVKFKIGDSYLCARLVVDSLDVQLKAQQVDYCDDLGIKSGSMVIGYGYHFHLDAHAVCGPEESFIKYIVT